MLGSPLSACIAGVMQPELLVSPGTLLLHPHGVWPPGSWRKAGILEGAPDTPAPGAQTPVTHRSSCFPWDTGVDFRVTGVLAACPSLCIR